MWKISYYFSFFAIAVVFERLKNSSGTYSLEIRLPWIEVGILLLKYDSMALLQLLWCPEKLWRNFFLRILLPNLWRNFSLIKKNNRIGPVFDHNNSCGLDVWNSSNAHIHFGLNLSHSYFSNVILQNTLFQCFFRK